jgi:hypothetical protein
MEIKASVLFYLLEKGYPEGAPARQGVSLLYPGGPGGDTTVSALRILDDSNHLNSSYIDADAGEPGVLYITDDPGRAAEAYAAAHTVIITGPAAPVKIMGRLFSIVVKLQDWDLRLKDAAARATGYTELFKIAGELFDFPVVLTNRNFTNLAYNQDFYDLAQGDSIDKWPIDVVSGLRAEKTEFHHLLESREPFLYPGQNSSLVMCYNIFKDNHLEGRLFAAVDRNTPHTKALLFLCARFCEYVSTVFIKTVDSAIQKKQQDLLHTLVRNAIGGTMELPEKDVDAMLEESGWYSSDPLSVVVFQLPGEKEFEFSALYICRYLELDFPESCAIIHESRIVWVVNNRAAIHREGPPKDKQRDFNTLIPRIVREFNCTAGISVPGSAFVDLKTAHVQAAAALRLGPTRESGVGYYHFSAYTLDYIIDRISGELPETCLCHPGLLALIDYDRQHGAGFLKTLCCYIDANYNMTLAAERHFLHRATLYRRMERIQEITHIDLDNPDELLHLSISLKLLSGRAAPPN